MKIAKFVLPVIAAGFAASSANAAVLAFHVDIDTVTMPGFVINTITVDTDADLTAAAAVASFTGGTLSQLAAPPFFPDAETASPVFDLSAGGLVDSYVQINSDSNTAATIGGGGAIGGGALPIFNSSGMDLTWDNVAETDIGNGLFIAQLVFANTVNGTFAMQAITATDELATLANFPIIMNGALVPEPASMALLGLGGLAVLRRR